MGIDGEAPPHSVIDAEALISADILNCRQSDMSSDRISAALATRVLFEHPVLGTGIIQLSQRGTWSFLGGFGEGLQLGETIDGTRSTDASPLVESLRVPVVSRDHQDVFPAVDTADTPRRIHLFGLHEPSFGVLFISIADANVSFTRGAASLIRHLVELCLQKGHGLLRNGTPTGPAAGVSDKGFFTDRQMAVLELLAQGQSNTEIGRKLSISGSLAKQEVAFLMHALGARNRLEAVVQGQRQGLLPVNLPPSPPPA